MKTKTIAMIMAMVMIVVCMVSGTLAWLTDSTDAVNNVFTSADIDVTLTETPNAKSKPELQANDIWQAQMIPGFSYLKDPKVEVSTTSVDCFLFVKFEEQNGAGTYLTYTSTLTETNGWTQGKGTDKTKGGDGIPTDVWYRKVMASDANRSWNLLAGDTTYPNGVITVKDTVTKSNMATAATAKLTYTAYATQLYKSAGVEFDAATAWSNIGK